MADLLRFTGQFRSKLPNNDLEYIVFDVQIEPCIRREVRKKIAEVLIEKYPKFDSIRTVDNTGDYDGCLIERMETTEPTTPVDSGALNGLRKQVDLNKNNIDLLSQELKRLRIILEDVQNNSDSNNRKLEIPPLPAPVSHIQNKKEDLVIDYDAKIPMESLATVRKKRGRPIVRRKSE